MNLRRVEPSTLVITGPAIAHLDAVDPSMRTFAALVEVTFGGDVGPAGGWK